MEIKEKIIHALGGYTRHEYLEMIARVTFNTIKKDFNHMLEKATSLNGLSGDEWAEKMYAYIKGIAEAAVKVTVVTTNTEDEAEILFDKEDEE